MPEVIPLQVEVRHRIATLSIQVSFLVSAWPAVLFGPSGAGKSTLLRILAGLVRAEDAHISFGNQILERDRSLENASMLQLVTQRPSLFPHLDVTQNIAFGLTRRTPAFQNARVEEMLLLLGAEALRHRMPHQLSGGERQRVAIARALAPAPQLLLLDEAFAGLDGAAKEELLGRLLPYFHEHSIASLHVTHELGEAFALQAHVIVLRDGKVVAEGPAATALWQERERLLALLGSVQPEG